MDTVFECLLSLLTGAVGEKVKNEKDDSAQQWRDRAAAGNAYSQPNTRELERNNGTSGVPWGGLSMRHVVERGWARDQEVTQQRSLEASAYFTQASTPGLQTKAGYYGTQYGGVQDPSSYLQDQHFQARAEPMMQGAHIRAPREEGGLSTGSYTLRSSMAASLRNMP